MTGSFGTAQRDVVLARADALLAAGNDAQAEAVLRRAVASHPGDGRVLAAMGRMLHTVGKLSQAEFFLRRAAESEPRSAVVLDLFGRTLSGLGKFEEAEEVLRRAIEADPSAPDPRVSMSNLLRAQQRHLSALDLLRDAIRPGSNDAALLNAYARTLHAVGRIDEALPHFQRIARAMPQFLPAAHGLCAALSYAPGVSPEEVFEAHKRYGQLLEQAEGVRARPRGAGGVRGRGQPLRVGLLSADLRTHAVSFFVEPFIRHADRDRVHVTCYYVGAVQDETTLRLRQCADAWRDVRREGYAELAAAIQSDRIDVLVELNGHSQDHRLQTMAKRPAPVLMTYLGYPNTTGVRTIDFRLVDAVTDPPGAEAFATERLLRVDQSFLCYQPPREAPEILAREAGSPVTFGSFASLQKVNGALLGLWAGVLNACPGSRLVLKHPSLAEERLRKEIAARVAAHGVDEARLEVRAPAGAVGEHLRAYGDIDISLDTHPYNGTTTVFESLLMGVPMVTRAGRVHAGRVTESILRQVGLADLVAAGDAEYVRIAAELARNEERRRGLRMELRERLLASALCDQKGHAGRLCDALYHGWNAELPERLPMAPSG